MFPSALLARVVGIGGMAGAVGGVVMAIAAGKVLQWTGSYTPLFLYAGIAYLVALGLMLLLAPGLQRAIYIGRKNCAGIEHPAISRHREGWERKIAA